MDRVTVAMTAANASTHAELAAIASVVSTEPFVLVTSAAHMPRAMRLCASFGLRPVPAPTDFLARDRGHAFTLRPTTQSIIESERALYEYASRLRNRWLTRRPEAGL
jgi:uncharacterized SAM-binding protein YcdF (DUF218 family)